MTRDDVHQTRREESQSRTRFAPQRAKPSSSRTDVTRQSISKAAPVDINGLPLSRRERRAEFWTQKQAEEAEAEAEEGEADEGPITSSIGSRGAVSEGRSQYGQPKGSSGTSSPHSRSRPRDDDVPLPIKYTTAASQFIYGANVVSAALASTTRKIYHLYMHKRAEADNIAQIRRLATQKGIPITRTADTDLLDRLSQSRPHNGVVLETSPLPALPVKHLKEYQARSRTLRFMLGAQSAEEKAVNGETTTLAINRNRAPIVVFLDGVLDPGNVGSIMRSAHFFGIDAVAISTKTCADLNSSIVAKASSGACEAISIWRIESAGEFIKSSAAKGWTVCAAVAPDISPSSALAGEAPQVMAGIDGEKVQRLFALDEKRKARHQISLNTTQLIRDNALTGRPTVLMLGGEGEGLPAYLKDRADVLLTIPQGQRVSAANDVGVDSMNVSVAAGILMNAMIAGEPHIKKEVEASNTESKEMASTS